MAGHCLHSGKSIFLIIDLQEKLMGKMRYAHDVESNTSLFINLCKRLEIPIIVTEQYPQGLGRTADKISKELGGFEAWEKISFSACGGDMFEKIRNYKRKQIIVAGCETHICVFQTVRDLLEADFEVYVLRDAVCSRFTGNYKNGLSLMDKEGAIITDTETAVYDLLKVAGTADFKAILPLIK